MSRHPIRRSFLLLSAPLQVRAPASPMHPASRDRAFSARSTARRFVPALHRGRPIGTWRTVPTCLRSERPTAPATSTRSPPPTLGGSLPRFPARASPWHRPGRSEPSRQGRSFASPLPPTSPDPAFAVASTKLHSSPAGSRRRSRPSLAGTASRSTRSIGSATSSRARRGGSSGWRERETGGCCELYPNPQGPTQTPQAGCPGLVPGAACSAQRRCPRRLRAGRQAAGLLRR